MRSIFVLGAHRVACLALYKSFLTQCHQLPSKTLQRKATAAVKREFRRNRYEQDTKKLRDLLVAAYKDEAFFRKAASGDKCTLGILRKRLNTLIKLKTPSPPRPKRPVIKTSTTQTREEKRSLRKQRLKEERKSRRLAKLAELRSPSSPLGGAGIGFPPDIHPHRRLYKKLRQPSTYLVPTLSGANAFPLLRFRGRKTPERVAMIIKNKVKLRQKRQDFRERLDEYQVLAEGEDFFDEQVARFSTLPLVPPGMLPGETAIDCSWARNNEEAIAHLKTVLRKAENRNKEVAEKFYDIVKKAEAKKARIKRLRIRGRRRKRRRIVRKRQMWLKRASKVLECEHAC